MDRHSYDLVIVGAGSGNMQQIDEFAGWRIAVAELGRFGGTCLNRGCIPSKMLVHTAATGFFSPASRSSASAPKCSAMKS